MPSLLSVSSRLCVLPLLLTVGMSAAQGDLVSDAIRKVSTGQYRMYQVDIQDMGLGLYGGPAYDQGYRSRDGWISGVAQVQADWTDGGTPGNLEARLYLVEQFEALGLEVSIQGPYRNIAGEMRGTQRPDDIYIVCGHYDTTSDGEHPGGDDNASGVAGVLEAARVLTQYDPNATLRFIGFNAEEDWMLGSQDYVTTVVAAQKESIAGVLNLDMILRPGWDSNPKAPPDLNVETGPRANCQAWARTFMAMAAAYVPSLSVKPPTANWSYWQAGDQGPFIAAGYPALMISENTTTEIWWQNSNAYYHQADDAGDRLANDPASPSTVTYDYEFAADVVRAAVATLAMEAGIVAKPIPEFVLFQALPTEGAEDIESFTVGDASYLAVANSGDDLTYSGDVRVYQWVGTGFVESQSIPCHGAADCEFFALGRDHYLAIANMRDDRTYRIDSKLYRWDGAVFVEFQSLPTSGAADCEFFTVAGNSYLAIANSRSDLTCEVNSLIYRWQGDAFVETQSIPTQGASDFASFSIGDDFFLAVANMRSDASHVVDSAVYKWDGTGFVLLQTIATQGARDWEFFTVGDASYLAVANERNDATYHVDSRIYKWNGMSFVSYQSVPTQGAWDWEFFVLDDNPCLAVAGSCDGVTHNLGSRIYRWNNRRFAEFRCVPTHGARDWEYFRIGGVEFLAAANSCDDASSVVESAVFQYRPQAGD